jgi:putative DNA-invertase from lambdoid prophage Rac
MRAAIYARVSTTDQRLDSQQDELRRYVTARGWTLAAEFADHGVSGVHDRRPGLDELMTLARRRQVDAVVVPAFDRFARSVRHLLGALDEFQALGVQFVSLREQIDTSTPLGRMVFVVVAAVAELERELIRERVRTGVAAARRRGKHVGRRPTFVDLPRATMMLERRKSKPQVARALGVSVRTLYRALERQGIAGRPSAGEEGPEPADNDDRPATTPAASSGSVVPETRQETASRAARNPYDPPAADRPCRKE